MRSQKIDKGKNISSENVEEATEQFLSSGGKIKKLPPDIPFNIFDLETGTFSKEVKDETAKFGNKKDIG